MMWELAIKFKTNSHKSDVSCKPVLDVDAWYSKYGLLHSDAIAVKTRMISTRLIV